MNRVAIWCIALSFVLSSFVASSASAGHPGARQLRQRARIQTGIENGSLVRPEARRLRHEQTHVRRARRRMLSDDGRLGSAERARLDRMQDRASRHIFRAKHNARTR
ncbi:MAG: hypothetical protein JRG94_25355 [Deltaproteobacteria bacterium]|nr:hypothetical protein [Deltaproteobacteria bacterium]MBW2725236.1 hypothetical protein [Deltaproteobacteria bacterium]